ncbi:hypothetical protein ACRYCC_27050 [Actinomadura scrupuli]|uniref:hypothetical protein n=1 Tax=Actinomadura scrupuli TaxID=559629 RepID=UPI003D98B048
MTSTLVPAWATAGVVVLITWLLREIALRLTPHLPHIVAPAPRIKGTSAGAKPYGIASSLKPLHAPAGIGVVGPGANAYVRSLLVEVLTTTGTSTVVISRNELNRLFEGAFDQRLERALGPRLHVSELLEDAIEQLELQLLVGEAAQANPDVGSPAGGEQPVTYWIATPGHDDDVVLPLLRRVPGLVGVMFGEWRQGPTYVIDATGTLNGIHGDRRAHTISDATEDRGPGSTSAMYGVTAALTSAQALARLHAHASTARASR